MCSAAGRRGVGVGKFIRSCRRGHIGDQQIVVQYRVAGFGGPDDLSKRHRIEDLLGQALESADIGSCDGGDIGSDRRSAEEQVVCTLRSHKLLDGAVIAVLPGCGGG